MLTSITLDNAFVLEYNAKQWYNSAKIGYAMDISTTYDLRRYVPKERLPLWVEYVPLGGHIERQFHDHKFSEIALVLHGSATHLTGEGNAGITAGDILVIHPGVRHAYDHTGDMELVNIVYDQKRLSLPLLDGYSLPLFRRFFPADGSASGADCREPMTRLGEAETAEVFGMIRHLEEELRSFKPGNFFLSLALFMEITAWLGRHDANMKASHESRFLCGEAIAHMHRNLSRQVAVDELVAISKMSRRNFFRHFKNATGCSPIDYMMRIRLYRATEMLVGTNLPVNEIALDCGFYDSNYFCRMFRRATGESPGGYRRTRWGGA